MSIPRIFLGTLFAVVGLLAPSRAADSLIAGFNFGQFNGGGPPSTDGVDFSFTGSIAAGFRGSLGPAESDSGVYRANNSIPGAYDPGYATWFWDGTNGSGVFENTNGLEVFAVEKGTNGVNSNVVGGGNLFAADPTGIGLSFGLPSVKWSLVVDSNGYADTDSVANFSFAGYSTAGATVSWYLNGSSVPFASTVLSATSDYNAYEVDLPANFYGQENSLIQGAITSGSAVVFDNVQINGAVATVSFSQQPVDASKLAGESAVFSLTVAGSGSFAYQWYKEQGNVALTDVVGQVEGATTATLKLLNLQVSQDGDRYYCVVRFNGATGASNLASLTVLKAPVAQLVSDSVTVNPGQDAVFEVQYSGNPAPSFQWRRDNVNLSDSTGKVSGSTTSKLVLSGLELADSGAKFTVVLDNGVGSPVVSGEALLTVNSDDRSPVIVRLSDESSTIVAGGGVTFKASVTGSPEPSLQWYLDDKPLVESATVKGVNKDTLELLGVVPSAAGVYTLMATNLVNSVEVSVDLDFTLVVQTPPTIDLAASNLSDKNVLVGGSAEFGVQATADPAPKYQWYVGQTPIVGATGKILSINPVALSSTGEYYVVVSNAAGSASSPKAKLLAGLIPSGESLSPAVQTVSEGSSVQFLIAASGTPEPEVNWLRDGRKIEGAQGTAFSLSRVGLGDAGRYSVELVNLFGSFEFDVGELKVLRSVDTTIPSKTQLIAPGSSVSIGKSRDAGLLRYRWFKNGKELVGVTTPYLLLENVSSTDSGVYKLNIYNSAGRLLSSSIVARIRVTVAGSYDALLRDVESDEVIGRVQVSVTDSGLYTGNLAFEDGKRYSLKGTISFPETAYQGTAEASITRSGELAGLLVRLNLDARASSLAVQLSLAGDEEVTADGEGVLRASSSVAWKGKYTLTLAPKIPVPEGQPTATANLTAKIDAKGNLALSGKLADGTAIKASFPSSVDATYAVFLQPYKGSAGQVAGDLKLIVAGLSYKATVGSSGVWSWTRPASGTAPAVDLVLDPSLAP